jgi:hypothetical protein
MQAEGDLVVAVGGAGHAQGEVVENALMEAVPHGEAMRRGKVDPRLVAGVGERDVRGSVVFKRHGPELPSALG